MNTIITIGRQFGSGGREIGERLAKELGIPFYDKELISLAAKESGLSSAYIVKNDEIMASSKYKDNNDDRLFVAEVKVIKDLAKHSCVIVGRCSNYILRDNANVVNIFLYSDDESKVQRAVKYYGLEEKNA